MSPDALHSFKNPPVVETVLGVQFKPLGKLTNAHLGAFWKRLTGDWPMVRDMPPLGQVFETFDTEGAWSEITGHLKLGPNVGSRLQIRNAAGDRMIQVQEGRLHYNWFGNGKGNYPRYRVVQPEFAEVFTTFRRFIEEESLGAIEPNQWEITYVNHFPKGTVWDHPCDWNELFPPLPCLAVQAESMRLEGFSGEWRFEIEPKRGRLHVEIRSVREEGADSRELLTMKLTARGPIIAQQDTQDITAGLDLGHEAIVRSFVELTSPKAHEIWGLVT